MKRAIVAALCACLATGCSTDVAVRRVDLEDGKTRAGIPYPLAFSRFEIGITRQVIDCPSDGILIAAKAEIKGPTAAPDPDNLFVIDPTSIAGAFKTSDLLVKYSEATGSPSSLNATVEDRTAQVIANIAGIAVSTAKLVALPGVPAAAPTTACSDAAVAALAQAKSLAPKVAAARKIVESRTGDLKSVQDKLAAMGVNADERTKRELADKYSALQSATADLDAVSADLDKALAVIVDKRVVLWPARGNEADGFDEVDPDVLGRWTRRPLAEPASSRVSFALRSMAGDGHDPGKEAALDPSRGIPVRQPVKGSLKVCRPTCKDDVIAQTTSDVLQLGYVYYLPCQSRPFSSMVCSLTIADSGRLTSMGNNSKVATAEALSGSLQGLVDKATEVKQTRADAATKRLEAQTAYLKALADRDAALAASKKGDVQGNAGAQAALNAASEQLTAKSAALDAQNALDDPRFKRP